MTSPTGNRTIDAYDRNAEKYVNKFNDYEIYKKKICDFCEKHIGNGSRILDLGCGPGINIATIFEKDHTCFFTGIDLSVKFISIAKERFPQFEFLRQDIRSLDLQSKFDIVIASFCIVHLTDEETNRFLGDISNLLSNDGCLYLSYMNGNGSGFESTSFSNEEIFFNYYNDEFILGLLAQNQLRILEMSKEEYAEPDGTITIDTFIYAKK